MECTVRFVTRPWSWPGSYVIVVVVVLVLAWLASPSEAFPLALILSLVSAALRPRLAGSGRACLPGEA
jgi:hypothetical protein